MGPLATFFDPTGYALTAAKCVPRFYVGVFAVNSYILCPMRRRPAEPRRRRENERRPRRRRPRERRLRRKRIFSPIRSSTDDTDLVATLYGTGEVGIRRLGYNPNNDYQVAEH